MNRILFSTTLALVTLTPLAMRGQDQNSPENPNRWSLGARFGLNLKANFHNIMPAPIAPPNPGPAADGANHFYQDGHVLVDSSGDAGGLTWNWSYQNSSQVVGNTLQFHDTSFQGSSLAGNNNASGDPQAGLELVYQRVLGRLPFLKGGLWGLESGFSYTDIDLRDRHTDTGTTTVTTDAYQLNGVVPPGPGYNGTFQGPGPLLGDTPTRSLQIFSSSQSSNQRLSGSLFAMRLGPFAEWDFTSRWSLSGSAGLTLAPASVDYSFSVTTQQGGPVTTSGHSSKTGVLYGPYLGGTLRYDFTRHWGVYLGLQFQNLNDMRQTIGSHTARLDPGATVFATVGTTWKF